MRGFPKTIEWAGWSGKIQPQLSITKPLGYDVLQTETTALVGGAYRTTWYAGRLQHHFDPALSIAERREHRRARSARSSSLRDGTNASQRGASRRASA
jgi:hypothetical protein